MITVVFAFQSIELFANHCIWNKAKGHLSIQRDGKNKTFALDQVERRLSTDEKITQVLPQLMQKKIDDKSELWKRYASLKKIRDSVVHLKSADHYVRGKIDVDSVYYRCLKVDPIVFPATCVSLMRHFVNRGDERWLDVAEDYLRAAAAT